MGVAMAVVAVAVGVAVVREGLTLVAVFNRSG